MAFLNYHHLRYFRAIATEGSITKAAQHLKISQSALSVQLRQLEGSLGQPLFDRKHKSLMLTEAGRIALAYADSIFRSGVVRTVDTICSNALVARIAAENFVAGYKSGKR